MSLLEDDLITCSSYRITTISPAGNSTTKLRTDLFRYSLPIFLSKCLIAVEIEEDLVAAKLNLVNYFSSKSHYLQRRSKCDGSVTTEQACCTGM